MLDVTQIKETISKAVVFKTEYHNTISDTKRQGFLEYLFPTTREKLICKAVMDALYADGGAEPQRKAVSDALNKSNLMQPMTVEEIAETYETAKRIALVYLANREAYENRQAEEFEEKEKILPASEKAKTMPQMQVVDTAEKVNVFGNVSVQKTSKKKRGAAVEPVSIVDIKATRKAMGIDSKQTTVANEDVLMQRYLLSLKARAEQKALAPEFQQSYTSVMSR